MIQPGARLMALSDSGETPAEVARLLTARGYGDSPMTVLEHMGGAAETATTATAVEWADRRAADFNTIAIECLPGLEALHLPRIAGLPDHAFVHDGQMTKREVRAATLAALGPTPGAKLWDVGAGCGSVAVEWMRAARGAGAIAVERNPARCAMIAQNALALGVPGLHIVEGVLPAALDGLDRPDALFIGGGITVEGVPEACWAALGSRGRLVANAVTVGGEARLVALQAALGGDLVRIAVSRAQPVGPHLGWKPMMAVTQWQAVKP
jgi:precorrin-6Y C5,15-methyltransferase (decarboxylating)